jgi:hypothetical protein
MKLTTIGIDLAKNVFQVHGADERGKTVLKKQFKRAQVLPFFANLTPCLIGMEACGSAHYWATEASGTGAHGTTDAPQFVKPFVKRNKNDAADAEAICEAVSRPNMRGSADQERRAAGGAGAPPGPAGLRQGEDSAGQPDPGAAGRVRHRPFPKASATSPSGCPRSSRTVRTGCPAASAN